MAAVAQRLDAPRPKSTPTRPLLRVVPLPRRRTARNPHRGDALFATTLALLMAVGIVAVLLVNTATQTQADRIAMTKQHLASLSLQIQTLNTDVDQQDAPSVLAARATALGMRPTKELPLLAMPRHPLSALDAGSRPRPQHLSARERAALRGRAG